MILLSGLLSAMTPGADGSPGLLLFVGLLLAGLGLLPFRKRISTVITNLRSGGGSSATDPEPVRRTRMEIHTEIWQAFFQYRSGTPIEQTAIPESHRRWAVGALTEMKVAELLDQKLPPEDIILNDVVIAGGKYNIDHLVLTRVGVVQVDSKRWGSPVEVIPSPAPSVAVNRHTDPRWTLWTENDSRADPYSWDLFEDGTMVMPGTLHSTAVSTCVFEASQLPGSPIALVFAVEGRASSSIPRGGMSVTHYTWRENRNTPPVIRRSPFPIIFCKASEVAEAVVAAARPLQAVTPPGVPGPAYMSLETILSAPGTGLHP